MPFLARIFTFVAFVVPHPFTVHHHHHRRHHHRHAVTLPTPTRFDICVANREQGEPGSLNPRYVNWHAKQGIYRGGFSMEHAKWKAGGGLKYAYDANEASERQQVAVFHELGRLGEWTSNNWPTIPPCRGA